MPFAPIRTIPLDSRQSDAFMRAVGAMVVLLWGILSPFSTGAVGADDEAIIADAKLSADGRWIAFQSERWGQDVRSGLLAVQQVGGRHLSSLKGNFVWFAWIGGSRLLMADEAGNLVVFDPTTEQRRPLLEAQKSTLPPVLLSPIRSDRDAVLMQWEDENTPGYPAVYRVQVSKRKVEKITSAFRPIVRWLASPDGRIGGGIGYSGTQKVIFGPDNAQGWRQIFATDQLVDPSFTVHGLGPLGAQLFATSSRDPKGGEGPISAYTLSLITGTRSRLKGETGQGVKQMLFDPISGLLRGWQFDEGRALPSVHALDRDTARPLIKNGWGRLVDASLDGERLLYRSTTLGETSTEQEAGQRTEQLGGQLTWHVIQMPTGKPIASYDGGRVPAITRGQIQRRDGTALPFVRLDPDASNRKIDVVYIHGGPHAALDPLADPFARALLDQGLTVWVPAFIGTAGVSASYETRGYGEWGGRMQRDIDLMALHIRQTRARGRKLLVAGGSYGGFSALLALVDQPRWYDGGLVINPVTDMADWIDRQSERRLGDLFAAQILGLTVPQGGGRDRLIARSPLMRASAIQAPLLILAGGRDSVVPARHSQRLHARLIKANASLVLIPDMGHRWPVGDTRQQLLGRIETFIRDIIDQE